MLEYLAIAIAGRFLCLNIWQLP